ncbi:hypothetical protein JCM11251_001122 [Rhodosporidiobolus azoricus]
MRKGSATSLRREAADAVLPSTPSRKATTVDEREEDEELTPRAAASAKSSDAPRSRQASLSSQTGASKPLHTPPTMFPSGIRSNHLEYSPSRSSSRAHFDAPTSSSSAPHTTAADDLPSRSSSPSSHYSGSSVSSDPPDDWATSHLPSGSSPTRSPLLADLTSAPTFRQPSLAQAADGLRESRPISEFDFAAAYAHSDGSVPPSPAVPAGFTPIKMGTEGGRKSPPLPPLPPPKEEKVDLPPKPVEPPVKDIPSPVSKETPQPAGVPRPVLPLQTPLPASPSVTATSASPTSAVSTVGSLPPVIHFTGASHLSPTSATNGTASTSLSVVAASSSSTDRPPSRSSIRSPGPSPQRPPRRQPSNLSLMSQKSEVSATSATSVPKEGDSEKPSPLALLPAIAPVATGSALPSVPASLPDPPSSIAATTSTTPPTEPASASISSPLSQPRTRPRGLSSVQSGSVNRRDRGPPPDIPEKSRRRTSTLMNPSTNGKRLSSYGALDAAMDGGRGSLELNRVSSKEEEGPKQPTPPASSSLSDPRASLSITDGGFLRDSFYESYAQSAASSSYPASPVKPPSHFREASSANDSPVASPVVLPPSEEPSRAPTPPPPATSILAASAKASHLRTGSGVSATSTAGTGGTLSTATLGSEDFHRALSAQSSSHPPLRSASALSSASSSALPPPNTGRSLSPAPGISATALQASLGNAIIAAERFPPRSSSAMDLARAVSPTSDCSHGAGQARPRSNTPSGRSDAKARAAAFIADLKKAKAEAAAQSASAHSSPVVEQQHSRAKQVEDNEDDTLVISAEQPMSPTVVISPSLDSTDISTASSPMLPSLPHSPQLPDSPIPPLRYQRSGSTFTTTTLRPISSPPLPPFPPQQPTKRPSQSSILTTSSISKPFPRDASFSPSSRSNTLSSLPPLPPSSLASAPLLRRRPLPMAIQVAGELKRARTSRERSKIYAEKINELAREKSSLAEWIGCVRDVGSAIGRTSVPSSPAKPRSARQESSTATFAPRPGDTYRAKEIHSSSFGPKDLIPSAPYPGVISLAASKYASNGGGSIGHGNGGGGGKSFFSGLGVGRGSLGRRASKRDHHIPHHHSSSSGLSSHATIPGSIRTSSISAPIALNSAPSTLSSTSGLRTLGGPRMPNPTPPNAHRASFDSRVSSPSGSPVFERGGGGTASANPARASFSYGTSPVPTSFRGGLFPPKIGDAGQGEADVDEEKVGRLADILPQAERRDLIAALIKAGGDDVLAISVYLSDEALKR